MTGRSFIDRLTATLLFLAAAALYVWSAGPGLTAYRDTGEMTVVLSTLGVAHPPGYPLYTLVGSLALKVLPGCLALRANYFSALAGAGALAALFLFLRRWCGWIPSIAGSLLLAFYRPFWELASVSEMYTFGLLWVVLTMDAAYGRRNAALTGLLFGLGLGVRMDTLILAPVLLWPFLRERRALMTASGFAAFGATIFAYLAIRSGADPFIDWGDPETMGALFRSLSRRSYGGGLDLISQSYSTGTNFLSSMSLFGMSLWRYFGIVGAALLAIGVALAPQNKRDVAMPVFAALVLSGPLFLYMANLPPNPHAVAILEASFVLPALFCAVLAALGLERIREFRFGTIVAALLLAAVFTNPSAASSEAVKRNAWALRDYSETLFRSAPHSAIVALREDVQLFGAWEAQLLEKRRPDVSIVAVGLSSSDWYWAMVSRWPTAAAPETDLKLSTSFGRLARGSRPVLTGYETDVLPESRVGFSSWGLLRRLTPDGTVPTDPRFLLAVSLSRDHSVRFPDDFFTHDLKTDEANAFRSQGVDALKISTSTAEILVRRAETLDPDLMQPLLDRGYLALIGGRMQESLDLYRRAEAGLRDLLSRAAYCRSLPDVVHSVERDLATALYQQGVVLERMGNVDAARELYATSITVFPTAIAHYNLGVTYWNRDWPKAAENFSRANAIDPTATQAGRYLEMLQKGAKR